jgi:hypothetical protein
VRHRALPLLAAVLVAGGCAGGPDGPPALAIARPPVVVVVFDEFPGDVLLRPDGQIDAERFPNFAALARTSTWFPNATTVYDSTFAAVPAILDARLPRPNTAADVRSHQPSVFQLMDRLGYDIVKVESATAVCPPRICIGARARRPGVIARLQGGGRPARLHRWIGAIRKRPHPTFYFHHALLPHEPWIYLPSGHRSRPTGKDPIGSINRWVGFHDPRLTEHNHMRHLLQVGYTDHELGRILHRLRRTGLLERSLLVVTADHGYSFDVGVLSRRKVSETNVEEIAPVPYFVKAPGQTEGAVNEGLARTVDIVPTIADLLGVRVRWPHDGHSAFSDATRSRDEVRLHTRDFDHIVRIGREELKQRRLRIRRARARIFGTGIESELLFGDPWATVYRAGPHRDLLDRRLADLRVSSPARAHASMANAGLVRHVHPGDELLPTRVEGTLGRGRPGALRDLAVAVNGRVRAVGRSFRLRFRPDELFSFVVPEESLRPGRNTIEVLEVQPGGKLAPLARVG